MRVLSYSTASSRFLVTFPPPKAHKLGFEGTWALPYYRHTCANRLPEVALLWQRASVMSKAAGVL